MADTILNNYSDDSKIKAYIRKELMSRVFHDIPVNILNTGSFSIISEYISQATEQMAFTSAFYFNESFITKSVLPDSIYAEAAIFDIGYSFANPSSTEILLELRLEELWKNGTYNADTGLYEFILDKDTRFNLSNGNVYSLDYDILFQWKDINTSKRSNVVNPAWNIQYINMDEGNFVAKNKNRYIVYRVTETWLCLFITVSEYTRTRYVVTNNMTSGLPNEDYLINIDNHICGFDIDYIDPDGNRTRLRRDHILPIHGDVKDLEPYIHYIMDNPNTIRFMFQMCGNRYFVPAVNSQFEITVYTCHGLAANFNDTPTEQPSVLTATTRYPNNANVPKAAFVISPSLTGVDIGTTETVRRETIEAYNTANVISTDHDIDEWFKTFYFKNIVYPYFFKRRDDPWGRIWSGYLALTDEEDNVFMTNTLHGKIYYYDLYQNEEDIITKNEVIIPPGWVWKYGDENRYTVTPITVSKDGQDSRIETARTLKSSNEKFIFANPFGIRIQKDPFAIGYFNPWISTVVAPTYVPQLKAISSKDTDSQELALLYHATPTYVEINRTYKEDFYRIQTYIDVSQLTTVNGESWVKFLSKNVVPPSIDESVWTYFSHPIDLKATRIPMLVNTNDTVGYLPFKPSLTYLCVDEKNVRDDGTVTLTNVWIQDETDPEDIKKIPLTITNVDYLYGSDELWGEFGISEPVRVTGDTKITCYGMEDLDLFEFIQNASSNYYILKLKGQLYVKMMVGTTIESIPIEVTSISITVEKAVETSNHQFGEDITYVVGNRYQSVVLNVKCSYRYEGGNGTAEYSYIIRNAVQVFIPYETYATVDESDGMFTFNFPTSNTGNTQDYVIDPGTIISYSTMRSAPSTRSIDYYRIPFSELDSEIPMFYMKTSSMPYENNNMRVVLHAYVNGTETGRLEMAPVDRDTDGTYLFQADMYPIDELFDVDNMIQIRSLTYGGGSWIPTHNGSQVLIDSANPQLRISILFKADTNIYRPSDIGNDDTYMGYILNDQYDINGFSLIQELKEMRSVVNWGESSIPTKEQIEWYDRMMDMNHYDSSGTLYDIYKFAREFSMYRKNASVDERESLSEMARYVKEKLDSSASVLIDSNGIISVDGKNILSRNIAIVDEVLDVLSENTYNELFKYSPDGDEDENVVHAYVKYKNSDYVEFANSNGLYIEYVYSHPISSFENHQDEDFKYIKELTHSFVIDHPFGDYLSNREAFNIDITNAKSSYVQYDSDNVNYSEKDVEAYRIAVEGKLTQADTLITQNADRIHSVDDLDLDKDYSVLYSDKDCLNKITPEEGKFYVIDEEKSLVTIMKYDGITLVKCDDIIIWQDIYDILTGFQDVVNAAFKSTNVTGGLEVQLMPFVEYALMNDDKFKNFVKTFTQVHKAIEPVIFKRLEGNHYLDCKLVATYGLPHSYCADKDYRQEDVFWPDLNVQISFDVKLYNKALAINTKEKLQDIIRDYFNRLTTVHTPAQLVTMNNNIYISHLIQRMHTVENVAYIKFNGWYTNEKGVVNGNYMTSDVQAIVMHWRRLEDMPTDELERFVPEMFVLPTKNIEINIIDDDVLA